MKHIVPSSRIVFTDMFILLVSVLMGINSVMSFSPEGKEAKLPPVNLPRTSDIQDTGITALKAVFITIQPGEKQKVYFYNDQEVTLCQLMDLIQKAKAASVIIRADCQVNFKWEEFCLLTSKFMKAGVKEISYATSMDGGIKP